ncbi:MAG TPA: hypothetical protein PKH31_13820 [Candidatus Sumerlaeota bacterium]|nr:hypothetical protein [Candidatus Sumerlaeota bacterium]
MFSKQRLITLGILAATITTAFCFFYKSDEDKIRNLFEKAERYMLKEKEESVIVMAYPLQQITGLATPDLVLKTDLPLLSGPFPPEEIVRILGQFRFQFARQSLKFQNIEIQFQSKTDATAQARAFFEGTLTGGQPINEARTVHLTLKKIKRQWYVSEASTNL